MKSGSHRVIQFSGLRINAVTHVALTMSIGLLMFHILLRNYASNSDNRKEKIKETLQAMGTTPGWA